ncbi:hypothetical protein [Mycolicibacter terrae]|uniref:hypothetical protein n=1 Tax=Mycolicibacter terrae TaxID=1788 RepID=UPI001F39F4FD|nr:hypothetical protein [Mycolicibacter terrae]
MAAFADCAAVAWLVRKVWAFVNAEDVVDLGCATLAAFGAHLAGFIGFIEYLFA